MAEEMISAENFLQLFTRALERLTLRSGQTMPLEDCSAIEAYMLGLASCFQFVLIDNTGRPESWVRLTVAGARWLKNPVPLEYLKVGRPLMLE